MLLSLLIALILVGAALAIIKLLPIDETIKQIMIIIVVVAVVIYVLGFFVPGLNFRLR